MSKASVIREIIFMLLLLIIAIVTQIYFWEVTDTTKFIIELFKTIIILIIVYVRINSRVVPYFRQKKSPKINFIPRHKVLFNYKIVFLI